MNGGSHQSKGVSRNGEDFTRRGRILFFEEDVTNLVHLQDLMAPRQGMLQLENQCRG